MNVYVDDLFIFAPDEQQEIQEKTLIASKLEIEDNGPLSHILGMRINWDLKNHRIMIDQQALIESLLSEIHITVV